MKIIIFAFGLLKQLKAFWAWPILVLLLFWGFPGRLLKTKAKSHPCPNAFSSWRMASKQTKSDLVIVEIINYEIFNLVTCIITNLSFSNDDRLCTHDINKGIHMNWGTFFYLKKKVPPNTKQKVFGASDYPSTLANSTLILLFSKMLKFSKNYLFQIKRYCEVKIMIFRNIPFIEMNFSNLIN